MEAGLIRMSRISGNVEDDFIRISVTDGISGTSFLSVDMTLDALVDFITNREPKCQFELRGLQNVGKRRENKHEDVFVPDVQYADKNRTAYLAVKSCETDGWEGRVEDAANHHNRRGKAEKDGVEGAMYSVLFTRFVDKDHAP